MIMLCVFMKVKNETLIVKNVHKIVFVI